MIAAVVVLYKPDVTLLDRLICSAMPQLDHLFVIDNTQAPSVVGELFFKRYHFSISYQAFGENKGIAFAQNAGIAAAARDGYSHVLLLDQDSALPPDMVAKLMLAEQTLVASGNRVAAVGPLYMDEKTGSFAKAIRHRLVFVRRLNVDRSSDRPMEADYLISSGSLIRLSVLRDVGVMREELFIDWVDIEWGLRARNKGYRCYIVPNAVMKHKIGDFSVTVLGREVNVHGEIRNYYIVRNATYLLRLKSMGWRWRTSAAFRIPAYVVFYPWYSPNRLKTLKLLMKAVSDGLRGKLGRIV